MKTLRRAALAAVLVGASFAQTITVPGQSTPVSLSWLYYNKMRWAGAWSSSTTYNAQDLVSSGGYGYISLSGNNLNNLPVFGGTAWWAQLPATASSLPSGSQTQYLQVQPNTSGGLTYRFASWPQLSATDYNFPAQTPGGSLIGGGANQPVTLTPCPLGTSGSDTGHYVYLSGGTGTAEAVAITGGTCTSGASTGTVTLTPANSHSGAWTIASATAGIEEAVQVAGAAGGGMVIVPAATNAARGTIVVSQPNVSMAGTGAGSIIQAANNASLQNLLSITNGATGFRMWDVALDCNRAGLGTAQNTGNNDYSCLSVHAAHVTLTKIEVHNAQETAVYVGDNSVAPNDFKISLSWIHDNGGTINSSGFGTGFFLGGSTAWLGAEITQNRIENNYNTVTGPGPSSAINAPTPTNVVVSGNLIRNNYNVNGGMIAAGNTGGGTCAGLLMDWSIMGNTIYRSGSFGSDASSGIEICGTQFSIAGNTIAGFNQNGVSLDPGSSQGAITGNTIVLSSGYAGIDNEGSGPLGSVNDMIETGNKITGGQYGIALDYTGIGNILITGNNFTGSATAGIHDLSTTGNNTIFANTGFFSPIQNWYGSFLVNPSTGLTQFYTSTNNSSSNDSVRVVAPNTASTVTAPSLGANGYNPLTQSGDAGYFGVGSGGADTGGAVFGVASSVAAGMRVDGPTHKVTIKGSSVAVNSCTQYQGSGSPNSVVTGNPCDIYLNTAGGAATTLWVKESGTATNTGWVGK